MTTSVLLVDDHELIRQGLARAFERDDAMTVVGQAGSVGQALSAWRALRPDVVVTDLQLPDGTGLDVIRAIRAEAADVGLVMLTMHAGDAQIFAAMEAGASAFLGKDTRAAEVVARRRARGEVAAQLPVRRAAGRHDAPSLDRRHASHASRAGGPRAAGRRPGRADIAGRLYLGESTAKTHITRIYDKLGASNRAQALVTAIRRGLLPGLVPSAR